MTDVHHIMIGHILESRIRAEADKAGMSIDEWVVWAVCQQLDGLTHDLMQNGDVVQLRERKR